MLFARQCCDARWQSPCHPVPGVLYPLPLNQCADLNHNEHPFHAAPLQVIGEMRAGLADWEAQKRWDTLGISAQVGTPAASLLSPSCTSLLVPSWPARGCGARGVPTQMGLADHAAAVYSR